ARVPPSGADAVVAEIVGVAFYLGGLLMRFDQRVVEPALLGEGDRLSERIEVEMHFVERVVRARPTHQRIGVAPARRLEFEHPFLGLGPPPFHPRFGLPGAWGLCAPPT